MNTTEDTTELLPLDKLVELIATHQEDIERQRNLVAGYESQVRQHLGQPKTLPVGHHKIQWTGPSRQFDAPRFMEMYPPEKNAHLYKLAPNNDAIPKSLKEQFMKTGTGLGTVKIK